MAHEKSSVKQIRMWSRGHVLTVRWGRCGTPAVCVQLYTTRTCGHQHTSCFPTPTQPRYDCHRLSMERTIVISYSQVAVETHEDQTNSAEVGSAKKKVYLLVATCVLTSSWLADLRTCRCFGRGMVKRRGISCELQRG